MLQLGTQRPSPLLPPRDWCMTLKVLTPSAASRVNDVVPSVTANQNRRFASFEHMEQQQGNRDAPMMPQQRPILSVHLCP